MEQDDGLLFDVMESRGYARAWETVKAAKQDSDVPSSPFVDWVFRVQAELMRRRRNGS